MEGLAHTLLTECIRDRPKEERRQDDRAKGERAAAQPFGVREIREWETHRTLAITDSERDPCAGNAQRGNKRDTEPRMNTMKTKLFDDEDSACQYERGACGIDDPGRSVELFGTQMDDGCARHSCANEKPAQKPTALGVHCVAPIMGANLISNIVCPVYW